MKYSLFLMLIVAMACTGKLSDDQRKSMKENMELNKVKKVSEVQLTEAALALGRAVAQQIQQQDKYLNNPTVLDSLTKAFDVEIISIQKENRSALRSVEKQLLEAYTVSVPNGDNIQKMGADSLLYTKPIVREHPDGSVEFLKALGIRLTRKQVVLSIKD